MKEGNVMFIKKVTKELVRDFSEYTPDQLMMIPSDIVFKDTLVFKSIVLKWRRPFVEWSNTVLTFPMFLSDFNACIPYMIGGKLTGVFRLRASGQTQGIVYIPEHIHGNWFTEISKGVK